MDPSCDFLRGVFFFVYNNRRAISYKKKEQKSGHVISKILVVQLVPPQRQQLLTILILEINTTLYISLQYYKVSLRRTTTFPGLISACSFTHLLRLILGLTKRRNNYFFSLYFCDDYKLNTQHT